MSSSQSVCLCKKVFEFLIRFSAAKLHTHCGQNEVDFFDFMMQFYDLARLLCIFWFFEWKMIKIF